MANETIKTSLDNLYRYCLNTNCNECVMRNTCDHYFKTVSVATFSLLAIDEVRKRENEQ